MLGRILGMSFDLGRVLGHVVFVLGRILGMSFDLERVLGHVVFV
jgi:hypothetical protein